MARAPGICTRRKSGERERERKRMERGEKKSSVGYRRERSRGIPGMPSDRARVRATFLVDFDLCALFSLSTTSVSGKVGRF